MTSRLHGNCILHFFHVPVNGTPLIAPHVWYHVMDWASHACADLATPDDLVLMTTIQPSTGNDRKERGLISADRVNQRQVNKRGISITPHLIYAPGTWAHYTVRDSNRNRIEPWSGRWLDERNVRKHRGDESAIGTRKLKCDETKERRKGRNKTILLCSVSLAG